MKIPAILLLIISTTAVGQTKYQKDFAEFRNDVNEYHAYLGKQGIDWKKVKEIYQPMVDNVGSRDEFIRVLEMVINELHNGHISLNTNLSTSNRIIPSGSDMFVEKKGNEYVITDIRKNYPAEQCGLKPGMQLVKFNGKNIDSLLVKFLPRYTNHYNNAMIAYALNMLFAGTHDRKRTVTVRGNRAEKDYSPDEYKWPKASGSLLEFRILGTNTGYIQINNSLFDNRLIAAFDSAMNILQNTSRIIIDLTETPSGGNSAVARAIMGRFVAKETPYQRHEAVETSYKIKRSWVEYVSPRNKTYTNPVIVMTGHWTGSMGEGIAIGFDAMGGVSIVGTKMAGLLGAIEGFTLPETNISFQIPTEMLYHVNGTPREDFVPGFLCGNIYETWEKVRKMAGIKEEPTTNFK